MSPFRRDHRTIPDLFSATDWDQFAGRHGLTTRELEVFRLVCRGFHNTLIAETLDIQLPTLRSHLRSVYGKLKCHHRVEAILLAIDAMNHR
jgi:DNA-binding CsgD family transcriptional regulator